MVLRACPHPYLGDGKWKLATLPDSRKLMKGCDTDWSMIGVFPKVREKVYSQAILLHFVFN